MRIVAIVQARMGSSRLPGKSLQDLGGEAVLNRVLGRVQRMRKVHQMLVATTEKSEDDVIAEAACQNGAAVFRGSEEDVLDRYYRAACSCRAEVVVRITADCPLIDPELSDQVTERFLTERPDYASNVLERTYPRGLDTEVMTFAALERAWQAASKPYQRIHVTPYLYQHPESFKLLSVRGKKDHSQHRWTLDTPEDLRFLQAVYARLGKKQDFTWHDVLSLLEREPALLEINREVAQKALHEG